MAGAVRIIYKRPVPTGAVPCKLKGKPAVRYVDGRGKEQTRPLTEDGLFMLGTRARHGGYYTGQDGKQVRFTGFSDYDATVQEAARREREAAGHAAGVILIDEHHLSALIGSHMAAYIEDMRRTGRAEDYCVNTKFRLGEIVRECRWLTLKGIRADALTSYLARLKDGGKSGKTVNDYLAAAKTFVNWCIKQGRLAANPLNGVARISHVDNEERRALTEDEIQRLLAAAPPYRRLVYRAALLTGLRHGELAKLQWGDLHIGPGERPFIALRAKTTKAKRADTLPLRADLADELRAAKPADSDPGDLVFPRVPYFQTFHKDREAANIDYEDRRGRKVVFHSLRVTYGTMLQRAGVPLRTAMSLMRHTDSRLTMNIYTDPALLDMAGAVESLPDLDAKPEAEAAREVPRCDSLVNILADLLLALLFAPDSEGAFLHFERQIVVAEASNGHGYPVAVLAEPLDVIGGEAVFGIEA